ncbi:hypothetical protein CCUS01_17314 [Colletotrichum cuscutae]|uniref:Autophagy-related protein 1 n=1 Tax=Colletotrichum cuscutae TaxID=1209917 RepID=A0AAI9V8J9_9PEZI|nr:hypothetical protein CCUS01_17314 [Colletotrichum cuscutae]
MDGKRRASCEPEPDLLSIDPVTSLRGSICNRKADRPPKPTLINSRTLCKQLAKRHKGSDVSYETMTHTTSLDQAEYSQVAVKEDVSHSIIVRLSFHARFRRSPKGVLFKREAFLHYPTKTGTFALRQARQGQAGEREEWKKLHITGHRRPMTMAHSVSLREGERWQQEHGARNSAGHLSTPGHDHAPFGSTPPRPSTYCAALSQALRPQALLSTLTHWPAAHVELKNRRCIGGSMAKTWQAAHPCSANIEDDWGVLGATGHGGCSTQRTLTWHVSGFGYPTPPASPVYDNTKRSIQQPITTAPHCQARYVPLTPEARLGRFLEGKLQLQTILGTGAYGVVYSAVDVKTGVRYAVKCLSKFNPDGTPLDRRQVAFQNREIRLHYLASAHPNVVSMLKIVDDPDCIYVILEYCPEGDLFFNITECGQYVGNDDLAKRVFLQVLDAVEHCHSLGIYHRDLKPENILVSDQGSTVKLADFGLATSSDRSEDYGCGSTFYMSPECLDHSARRPFYFCAPNDVWSLGVILVNLTCGRNPWKQASFEDSTYRAYTRCPETLKSILPVSDELNDILGRIFTRNPDQRITLAELKARIQACSMFTIPATPTAVLSTTQVPHEHTTEYVTSEDTIVDDYDNALSPASSSSDEGSTCSSDEGSLTSSGSTIDDLDEDFLQEQQETMACHTQTYEPEDTGATHFSTQDYIPQHYTGPVPSQLAGPESFRVQRPVPTSAPLQAQLQAPSCPSKSFVQFWWGDVLKYAQQAPAIHPHVPFHHQVPILSHPQGCY